MNELNRNIKDFLMARDLDKNELIRYISIGGGQRGGYQENKDYDQDRGFNGFQDFTKNTVNSVAGFIGNNIYNNQGNNSYNNRGGNQNKPSNVIPPSPQFNNSNQGGYGKKIKEDMVKIKEDMVKIKLFEKIKTKVWGKIKVLDKSKPRLGTKSRLWTTK